jgi:hypothetical protein
MASVSVAGKGLIETLPSSRGISSRPGDAFADTEMFHSRTTPASDSFSHLFLAPVRNRVWAADETGAKYPRFLASSSIMSRFLIRRVRAEYGV